MNPLALAVQGVGFGVLSVATQGLLTANSVALFSSWRTMMVAAEARTVGVQAEARTRNS